MQDTLIPTRAPAKPARLPLAQLEQRDAFCARHIGPDAADEAAMLAVLGYATRAALIDDVVPAAIRESSALAVPAGRTETEALAELREIAPRTRCRVRSSARAITARICPA